MAKKMDKDDPVPRMKVEEIRIDQLRLDEENPRRHSTGHISQIARSIEAFHFNVPVLVDGAGKVLAGHGRVLACRKLGMNTVPAIRLEHLTDEQARAFSIAENRLVETGQWDEPLLAGHLKMLSSLDLDFSVEATGFSLPEIDLKIQSLDIVGEDAPDPDEAPVSPGWWRADASASARRGRSLWRGWPTRRPPAISRPSRCMRA